jgi:serine/threonine protein kinase
MNVSGPRAGVFAEYDIHDHLGSGAFARVHRAMHIGSGQWYALKIITATDQKMKENFSREISTMEMLSHKNICKLRETFIENERICGPKWLLVGHICLRGARSRVGVGQRGRFARPHPLVGGFERG